MKKPVYGMLIGGILGIFDGLSALISAPETAPGIAGIVVGSTIKGILVGLILGFIARRTQSPGVGVVAGLIVGAALAGLVVYMQVAAGQPSYFWEIVLPGSIVGIIVGYATVRHQERQPA